jgi:hypothetical protein
VKLADLNARFVALRSEAPDARGAVALMLPCPCGCRTDLTIPFENPIDAEPVDWLKTRWRRTGETLDTLTLHPSVNALPTDGCKGWHGWIKNGEATGV